jgi:sugar phosphate isomerase/epimerase
MDRRSFIEFTSLASLGTLLQACSSNASLLPTDRIGIQLFTLPKLLEKDFAGTMKLLASKGYKEVEFFGPYSFSAAEAQERWKSVTTDLGFSGSGYFGLQVQEVKKILDDNGLSSPSMHTDIVTLRNNLIQLAEAAHVLGQTYAIIPSAPTRATLDEYKKDADEYNEIGAKAKSLGIRFGYHNHGNGLKPLEGEIPFDLTLKRTEPNLVFFEMDIFWTTAGGADPIAYLDKYPGRFRLMHIKDMSKDVRFPGDGGDPQQWISLFPYLADPGSGVLDLKKILSHAKKSGVEHFLLEHDLTKNPDHTLENSYRFLSGLKAG